jgi:thiol-disulfide isomerase/thioredoxin
MAMSDITQTSVMKGATVAMAALAILTAVPAQAADALDFELPGENGFVRLSELPPRTTVVNFWRADCPPCLREMPVINSYATAHPELRIVAVALQSPGETRAAPIRPHAPVVSLHGPSQPKGLLARFGNRSGALPFTVALDARRVPCAHRIGEIDAAWLEGAALHCGDIPEKP